MVVETPGSSGGDGGSSHISAVDGLLKDLSDYKGTYSETTGTYNSSENIIVVGRSGLRNKLKWLLWRLWMI